MALQAGKRDFTNESALLLPEVLLKRNWQASSAPLFCVLDQQSAREAHLSPGRLLARPRSDRRVQLSRIGRKIGSLKPFRAALKGLLPLGRIFRSMAIGPSLP